MKNWWGAESHPSDDLVHWSVKTDSRQFKQENDALRAAWDLIHSTPEMAKAFKLLRDSAVYNATADAEYDAQCCDCD